MGTSRFSESIRHAVEPARLTWRGRQQLWALAAIAAGLLASSATADEYSDAVHNLNPVAYWRLDEASGRVARDIAGGYDGSYERGVRLGEAGVIAGNAAVRFDGSNDHVEVSHATEFLIDNGTIQFWFKADRIKGRQGLFSKDSSDYDTGGHLTIYLDSSQLKARLQSRSRSYTIEARDISADTWYHMAFSFGSQGMKLYLNGQLKSSYSHYTGGLGSTSGGIGNYEPIAFGANSWNSRDRDVDPLREYFRGLMDEVAIFGEELAADDIEDLADGGWQFVDVTDASDLDRITNTYGHAWGDYDENGYPDLIVTGTDRLYRNEGDGTFKRGPSVSSRDRAAHWGDYDNDGNLDFGATYYFYLNRNEGNGRFRTQHNSSIGITALNNLGDFAWLDYNLDGRLDIWAPNGNRPFAYLYRNDGNGTFSAIEGQTIGLSASTNGESTVVADYDDDGNIDILYRANRVYLWKNNGDGTFTETTSAARISLTGTSGGYNGTAFGDYDNDGDLDLYGAQGGRNKLYRNNGDGTFTDVTSAAGVAGPSATSRGVAWGDFDNDGDLDLYVAHENAAGNLYQNNGDGTFTDIASAAGVSLSSGSYGVTWEDYDLDGDLDLYVGRSSGQSRLFRNTLDDANYLRVRVIGGGACQTNVSAVGVRVDLYDEDETTLLGRRTIGVASGYGCSESMWAHFGGIDPGEKYTVKVYFVSGTETLIVRPEDASTTIGGTVIDQMLTVVEPETAVAFNDVSDETGFDLRTTTDYHSGSGFHWADMDEDGDLDAIITGNRASRLLISNGQGQSFFASTFGTGAHARQGALVDIDNDGDIDFWHCDEVLYQNNGSASFTSAGNLGFNDPSNNEGAAAADVNGDGWCDLVMFSGNGNWIGHHQAALPVAVEGTKAGAYGLHARSAYGNGDFCSSGDVNNDGQLDFFYNYSNGRLFLSDGDGTYTWNNLGISVVTGNSDKMGSAWGDYDNDGDLDLFVPRYDQGHPGYLWRNDGGVFTNVASTAGITDASGQRSCCWGDYDNDGDLDLYVVTHSGASNVLYENQGNGSFLTSCAGAEAPGNGHDAVFVDYDNDGDLDLAAVQEDTGNTLLENATDNLQYLKVRVIGAGQGGTNKAGIGVRVELYAADGATLLARRDVGLARGFAGTDPLWVHFGGVDNSATYVVKVHFLSEIRETTVVPANASTTIGSTTIAQMLTVEELLAGENMQVIQWSEVDPGE